MSRPLHPEDIIAARSYSPEDIAEARIVRAARTAHEVNRAYCHGLGDHSQPEWEDAPEWQRSSAINGVLSVMSGNIIAENNHESWLEEKRRAGWKYGPVKDPEKKEHPCFLPYKDLPIEQRAKDWLFVATVRGVLGL